jgi:two-component system sensor histidine kinase CpxA
MNRRLFWKIFLPFWVAQAVLLGALYLRIHYRISSEHPWWIQPERREMPVLANLAAQTFEQQGQAGLAALLDKMSLPNRSRFWLVDGEGHELSGREIPQRLLDDAAKAEQSEGLHHSYEANVLAAATTTSRTKYVLIAELVPPPLRERVPGDILWTLKLGTVFSAVICLVIAHYLTKPIERLRNATHQLARGDLDIRAGENLGNRRDEIADLVRDFDTMASELRKQIQSERSLLSGVSHELRSPIARIRLALTLAREAGASERREMLDRIEQDAIQLDSMLERILTVSRLESGQLKPHFERLSLNELVDEVLHDAEFEAAATHATITRKDLVGALQVTGDPGLLRSAIENVVRNAIFYSGEGGKVEVTITATEDRLGASVIVRDNGPGVPQDKMPLIFEPFYRVDDSRGTTTGGMGLGLAIANNAMRAHGGGIIAHNVEPHGLEIMLAIPSHPQPLGPGESYGPFVHQNEVSKAGQVR